MSYRNNSSILLPALFVFLLISCTQASQETGIPHSSSGTVGITTRPTTTPATAVAHIPTKTLQPFATIEPIKTLVPTSTQTAQASTFQDPQNLFANLPEVASYRARMTLDLPEIEIAGFSGVMIYLGEYVKTPPSVHIIWTVGDELLEEVIQIDHQAWLRSTDTFGEWITASPSEVSDLIDRIASLADAVDYSKHQHVFTEINTEFFNDYQITHYEFEKNSVTDSLLTEMLLGGSAEQIQEISIAEGDFYIADSGVVLKWSTLVRGVGLSSDGPDAEDELRLDFEVYDFNEDIAVVPPALLTAEDYLDWGTAALELDYFEQALIFINQAIILSPDWSEPYICRGHVHTQSGDLEQALLDFTEAIELDPSYATAYKNRAAVLIEQGNASQALIDLNQAISLDPDYAEAYDFRGVAYTELGDMEQAILDCNQAILLDPELSGAYNNRGSAYQLIGDLQQAIQDYDKAIELDPNYAMAFANRGQAYNELGDFSKALDDLNRAIELDPELATAYNGRGMLYRLLGEYAQALIDYEKALEIEPNFLEAYYNRAIVYFTLEEFENALADLDKVIELDPDLAKAYLNRGIVYGLLEDYDQAILDLEKYVGLAPDAPDREEVLDLIEQLKSVP
jgi:tetratricopeptide (TPR) repeat protein